MFRTQDFEKLYVRYMAEAVPRGESIQAFCKKNGVPHSLFDKWYKDTRHGVVKVTVEGAPEPAADNKDADKTVAATTENSERPQSRIMIDIRSTNGLHLQQRNLSYQQLLSMVEKLEGLC